MSETLSLTFSAQKTPSIFFNDPNHTDVVFFFIKPLFALTQVCLLLPWIDIHTFFIETNSFAYNHFSQHHLSNKRRKASFIVASKRRTLKNPPEVRENKKGRQKDIRTRLRDFRLNVPMPTVAVTPSVKVVEVSRKNDNRKYTILVKNNPHRPQKNVHSTEPMEQEHHELNSAMKINPIQGGRLQSDIDSQFEPQIEIKSEPLDEEPFEVNAAPKISPNQGRIFQVSAEQSQARDSSRAQDTLFVDATKVEIKAEPIDPSDEFFNVHQPPQHSQLNLKKHQAETDRCQTHHHQEKLQNYQKRIQELEAIVSDQRKTIAHLQNDNQRLKTSLKGNIKATVVLKM